MHLDGSYVHVHPDPLVLTIISRSYINLALNSLIDEPKAHIVLKHPTEDEVVSPETEAVRRSCREFFKNCVIPNKKVYSVASDILFNVPEIHNIPIANKKC